MEGRRFSRVAAVSMSIGCALLTGGYGAMRFAEAQQNALSRAGAYLWFADFRASTQADLEAHAAAVEDWELDSKKYSDTRFNQLFRKTLAEAKRDPYEGIVALMTQRQAGDTSPSSSQAELSPVSPGRKPVIAESIVIPGAMWIHASGVGAMTIGGLLIGSALVTLCRYPSPTAAP